MRWDAKTKKALIDLLRVKLRTALSAKMAQATKEEPAAVDVFSGVAGPFETKEAWELRLSRPESLYKLLLKELGMSLVKQTHHRFGRNHWADPETKSPARTKDHILIKDPLRGRIPTLKYLSYGLKIPKETAMKILVLNHLPSGD